MQNTISNSYSGLYTIYDMTLTEVKELENKLRPGNFSTEGFISADDDLHEIYKNDLSYLESKGISCEQVANTLKGFIRKAQMISMYSNEIILGTKFKITGTAILSNGYQECPFPTSNGKDCFHGRGDYIVTELSTGDSFSFSGLAIHLIEKHGFFEGNTPYRVDLAKIIRISNLTAESYKQVVVREWKFVICGKSNEHLVKYEKNLKKHAKQIEIVDEFAVAYLGVPFVSYKSYKYSGKSENEISTIKYMKQGLTHEEAKIKIEEDNNRLKKWGFSSDKDKKIIHPEGKEYMHFINKLKRFDINRLNNKDVDIFNLQTFDPIVAGIQIKAAGSYPGSDIYELNEFTYADVDCG